MQRSQFRLVEVLLIAAALPSGRSLTGAGRARVVLGEEGSRRRRYRTGGSPIHSPRPAVPSRLRFLRGLVLRPAGCVSDVSCPGFSVIFALFPCGLAAPTNKALTTIVSLITINSKHALHVFSALPCLPPAVTSRHGYSTGDTHYPSITALESCRLPLRAWRSHAKDGRSATSSPTESSTTTPHRLVMLR